MSQTTLNEEVRKEVKSIDEVKALVASGDWLLRDQVFVLVRKSQPKKETKQGLDWNKIAWHTDESKPGFSWTFASDKQNKLYEDIKPFFEILKQGPVKDGQFEYQLSKSEKFIQRVKHSPEA